METEKSISISRLNSDELKKLLMYGQNINNLPVIIDEDIKLYEQYKDELLDTNTEFNFSENYNDLTPDDWLIPDKYKTIDVLAWLLDKCHLDIEINRVKHEYNLYEQKNLIILLKFFIYLIDNFRKNNIVWGVGRGSSVSSYILYLIGVHRVDSLKYNLQIEDYLK